MAEDDNFAELEENINLKTSSCWYVKFYEGNKNFLAKIEAIC